MDNTRLRKRLWPDIIKKTGGVCYYCGGLGPFGGLGIDHVTPRSQGGTDDLENLVPCCGDCNSLKGVHDLEVFRIRLAFKKAGIKPPSEEQVLFYERCAGYPWVPFYGESNTNQPIKAAEDGSKTTGRD